VISSDGAHATTIIQQVMAIAAPVTLSGPITTVTNTSTFAIYGPSIVSALVGAVVALVGVWLTSRNDRKTRNIDLIISHGKSRYEKLFLVTRKMLTVLASICDCNGTEKSIKKLFDEQSAHYEIFRKECKNYHDMWVDSTPIQHDDVFFLMSYFLYLIDTGLLESGKPRDLTKIEMNAIIVEMVETIKMTVELLKIVCHKKLIDTLDIKIIETKIIEKLLEEDDVLKRKFEADYANQLKEMKKKLPGN